MWPPKNVARIPSLPAELGEDSRPRGALHAQRAWKTKIQSPTEPANGGKHEGFQHGVYMYIYI